MNCEKVIGQFSAYLDGQLTVAEREAVRSHIAACARCRDELDALARTVYAVADLPRLSAPADLRDQVMAKLDGVAPAQARHPRWRMYWGAAAAVAFAVVIMLLTRPQLRPLGKNVADKEVALADRGGSAGSKGADEKFLWKVANVEPTAGPVDSLRITQFKAAPIATMSSGQIVAFTPASSEQIVLPSANPRVAYFNAVGVAAKGGWLPAELQKRAAGGGLLTSSELEQRTHQDQVLQLVFSIKRSQVPLLKNALAAAGLQAAEEKGGRAEEAQPAFKGAPLLAFTPARRDLDSTSNAMPAESRFGLEGRSAAANTVTVAARASAPAAMKAPESAGGAEAAGARQAMAPKEAQPAEATTLRPMLKAEAAEEPLVQVTLLFPLAESSVPAAAPAAGAAGSATPE